MTACVSLPVFPTRCGLAATLIALAAALSPAVAVAHSLDHLEQQLFDQERYFQTKDAPAPDFSLYDADGASVSLRDLHEKVVILHFVYTSCADVCPLHAEKLAEVQEMIAITPMKEEVAFVTVTTDPKRDTPEILRAYGPLHGLDAVNWMFLTSGPDRPEDETRKLAQRFGHKFTAADDGFQTHGIVTHVIDRDGRWRANFHGLDFNPTNLVLYVNGLLNDVHKPGEVDQAEPSFWDRLRSWF